MSDLAEAFVKQAYGINRVDNPNYFAVDLNQITANVRDLHKLLRSLLTFTTAFLPHQQHADRKWNEVKDHFRLEFANEFHLWFQCIILYNQRSQ